MYTKPPVMTSTGLACLLMRSVCSAAMPEGMEITYSNALAEYPIDDVVNQYWEARCQMVMNTSAGIGVSLLVINKFVF
ncbi:hypothetical protein TNCV_3176281 [Trichonephila clavipes]|nr:hypothetical protein TNCV_3176281 [Trichonephila clavipes]